MDPWKDAGLTKMSSLGRSFPWANGQFFGDSSFLLFWFLFRYTVEFHQYVWDYAEYEYGWGWYEETYDFGSVTKITVTGRDVNFSYSNTVGGDLKVFQRHKNVKVYGAIPSNTFKPANVKIDNFRFTKERNYDLLLD